MVNGLTIDELMSASYRPVKLLSIVGSYPPETIIFASCGSKLLFSPPKVFNSAVVSMSEKLPVASVKIVRFKSC